MSIQKAPAKPRVSKKTLNVYQRLHKVIEECGVVEKTDGKGGVPFQFHAIDDVVAHLRPFLIRHGLAFFYTLEDFKATTIETPKKSYLAIEKEIRFSLVNVDKTEDCITSTERAHVVGTFGDHGSGKATSYAVKTWLLNMFMLRGQSDAENFSCDYEINKYLTKGELDFVEESFAKLGEKRKENAMKAYGFLSTKEIRRDAFPSLKRDLLVALSHPKTLEQGAGNGRG